MERMEPKKYSPAEGMKILRAIRKKMFDRSQVMANAGDKGVAAAERLLGEMRDDYAACIRAAGFEWQSDAADGAGWFEVSYYANKWVELDARIDDEVMARLAKKGAKYGQAA